MTDDNQNKSRFAGRAVITFVVVYGFIFLFPNTICGCHFRLEALLITLVPVLWGGYALVSYRDRKEQIVGWIAFAFALASMWIGTELNLRFAFG